jgi:hypothetical protein
VGAVVVALGFAVYNFAGGSGGAASPEAAVDQLFTAIDNEDVIGVVTALSPGEREVLKPGVEDLTAELQRLGVLSDFDLGAVPGVDLQLDGYELQATSLADGISSVEVTNGALFATTFPDDYPIGDTLRSIIENDFEEDLDFESTASAEDFGDFELVAVEEDGGWHVSIGYSIAEAARGENDSVLSFGEGPDPVGADTPDGAVMALVEAGNDLDAEAAVTMLDPRERGALNDYAPLFLDVAAEAAADARDDDVSFEIDNVELESTGSGDTRRVVVGGFDVSFDTEYDSGDVSYDGECYSWDIDYNYEEYYFDEPYTTEEPEGDAGEVCAGEVPDVDDELYFGGSLFPALPSTSLAFTVVERDGKWFVSPVRTVLDSAVGALEALEPGDIEDMGAWLSEFFGSSYDESQFEAVGGAISSEFDECWSVYDEFYEDDSIPYERADYLAETAYAECVGQLVESGAIDRDEAPPPYLDECWVAYVDLPPDADESQWLAADAAVIACQDADYEDFDDLGPLVPVDPGTFPGVDPGLDAALGACFVPDLVGDEVMATVDLTGLNSLTPGVRQGLLAFRDCLADFDPSVVCLGTLADLSATLPDGDFLIALDEFASCAFGTV